MIFPLQVSLKGIPVLVIGGGPRAARWIYSLLEAGAELRVCSAELDFELENLAKTKRFEWIRRAFRVADFDASRLIVIAGEKTPANRKVLRLALARKLWTISADPRLSGNAWLPPTLRRGGLLIHFNLPGEGKPGPADEELGDYLRRRLSRSFGREWELVWAKLKARKGGSLQKRLPAWLKSAKKKRIYKKTL